MALNVKHFLLIFFVLIADQLSKFFIKSYVSNSVVIFPFLKLSFVKNAGVAFGLFNNFNLRWFFVGFAIAIIVFLFNYSKKEKSDLLLYSISLIIAGAFGNTLDRILFSSVVDFIDFGFWPAFNIADSAITIGIAGFLLSEVKNK